MLASFSLSADGLSPSDREDGNISSILAIAPEITENCTGQPMDIILAIQHPNTLSSKREIPKQGSAGHYRNSKQGRTGTIFPVLCKLEPDHKT